jgi:hypothetical protein
MSDVSHQKAVGTIFPGGLRKMKIYRFVLRATLLFVLMGFTAISTLASGPGQASGSNQLQGTLRLPTFASGAGPQPKPDVTGTLRLPAFASGAGPQPKPDVTGILRLPALASGAGPQPKPDVAGILRLPAFASGAGPQPKPDVAGTVMVAG